MKELSDCMAFADLKAWACRSNTFQARRAEIYVYQRGTKYRVGGEPKTGTDFRLLVHVGDIGKN